MHETFANTYPGRGPVTHSSAIMTSAGAMAGQHSAAAAAAAAAAAQIEGGSTKGVADGESQPGGSEMPGAVDLGACSSPPDQGEHVHHAEVA